MAGGPRTSSNQGESRYRTLRGYATFLSGVGWIITIGGVLGGVIGMVALSSARAPTQMVLMTDIAGIVLGFLGGISWVIAGQVIRVLMDIEVNTRLNEQVVTLLRRLLPATAIESESRGGAEAAQPTT